jgi:hypothetical protein
MENSPAEIIKEFIVHVEGLNFTVKGRIKKTIKGEDQHLFIGELSHYCKPLIDAATVYQPSLVKQDYNTVEHLVIRYLESFTTFDVMVNKYY